MRRKGVCVVVALLFCSLSAAEQPDLKPANEEKEALAQRLAEQRAEGLRAAREWGDDKKEKAEELKWFAVTYLPGDISLVTTNMEIVVRIEDTFYWLDVTTISHLRSMVQSGRKAARNLNAMRQFESRMLIKLREGMAELIRQAPRVPLEELPPVVEQFPPEVPLSSSESEEQRQHKKDAEAAPEEEKEKEGNEERESEEKEEEEEIILL